MIPRRLRIALAFLLFVGVISLFSSTPAEFREHIDRHAYKYRKWFGEYYWRSDLLSPVELDSMHCPVEETTLSGSMTAAGFTVFDKLYLRGGALYAVTRNPDLFPDIDLILAPPEGTENVNMNMILPDDANTYLGEHAVVLDGMSFILWDSDPFLSNYYRWWGELMLGAMRLYSGLSLAPGIRTPLPAPQRFLLPNIPEHHWRDSASVNGPILRAGWPSTAVDGRDFWEDLMALNQTFVFEHAMIISRPAAYKSRQRAQGFKMISSAMDISVPHTFWQPTQRRVVWNTLGYLPVLSESGPVLAPIASKAPIVTYISPPGGAKRIDRESQQGLVEVLTKLERAGVCELHVVAMERMTFTEQLEIVAKTTIMVGMHGTGLTHQLWMPSSPRSTIIEFLNPMAYPNDYEILSQNVGHKHYAIWNDRYATYPGEQKFAPVEYGTRVAFDKGPISVNGSTVAKIIRERLTRTIHNL